MNDNPSAFPRPSSQELHGGEGMSLRDWFAGKALMGMIASAPIIDRTDPQKVNKKGWAEQAYSFADAMLDVRKGGRE